MMATFRKRVRIAANGEEKVAWVADYHDQHKKRHLKTFSTRKAAAAWLVETQGEVTRGTHTPERASVNVWEAAQLWLERGKVEELERGTMRNYDQIVRLHIAPTLGAAKLAQLSTPMLESWRDRLVARCSRTRARKVLGILKAILSEAQRRGLVGQNAALPVKVDAKRRDMKKLAVGRDIPGKEDIQRLLVTVTNHPWARHRPLFITAVFTGMRASELRGLPWSAIDFAKRTITVRQRADEWGTIGMPKSAAGQREIPMSPTVLNTLREWKLGPCPKGELDLVFPNTLGRVQPLTNITHRVWHPLQKAAGLVNEAGEPLFNFHALRHFAALAVDRARLLPEAAAGDAGTHFGADDLRSLRAPVPIARGRSREVRQGRDRGGRLARRSHCTQRASPASTAGVFLCDFLRHGPVSAAVEWRKP
jgi:integrase